MQHGAQSGNTEQTGNQADCSESSQDDEGSWVAAHGRSVDELWIQGEDSSLF